MRSSINEGLQGFIGAEREHSGWEKYDKICFAGTTICAVSSAICGYVGAYLALNADNPNNMILGGLAAGIGISGAIVNGTLSYCIYQTANSRKNNQPNEVKQ